MLYSKEDTAYSMTIKLLGFLPTKVPNAPTVVIVRCRKKVYPGTQLVVSEYYGFASMAINLQSFVARYSVSPSNLREARVPARSYFAMSLPVRLSRA